MTKARDIASAIPAPSTVSSAELGFLDGVTSAVQTQLNAKQAVVSGVDDTEIGYLNGVTSAIQTQLDAKTAKSTLSTTGDIYYASAANTPARLGIGSSAQVLTVAAGVPAWATPAAGGSMTLLSTTSISGTSTTVSSISQSYKNLFVEVFGCTWDTSNDAWTFATNLGAVNSSKKINATSITSPQGSITAINQINDGTDNIKRTGGNNYVTYNFTNYASTSTYKTCAIYGSFEDSDGNAGPIILFVSINSNTAINEFTFAIAGSQNMTAGTIKIYGVN